MSRARAAHKTLKSPPTIEPLPQVECPLRRCESAGSARIAFSSHHDNFSGHVGSGGNRVPQIIGVREYPYMAAFTIG